MRRFLFVAIVALSTLSSCSGGDLPSADRALEVPRDRLASAEARSRGRQLYLANCAICHGEKGDGNGIRRNLSSRPRNFTDPAWRDRATPRHVFVVIRDGLHGTAMAAWSAFDDDEIWDLVAYVLSIGKDGRQMSELPGTMSAKGDPHGAGEGGQESHR